MIDQLLNTGGPYAICTIIGVIIAKLSDALVKWRKNDLDAEGHRHKLDTETGAHRDGLQASRISELERRMDDERRHCDARLDVLNARIVVVAQSTMELSSVVEVHDPASPALARARLALQHAFPLNFDTPADLLAAARKLGEKHERL